MWLKTPTVKYTMKPLENKTIAVDFDNTLKTGFEITVDECIVWGNIIKTFLDAGATVILATMRSGTNLDKQEISRYFELAGVNIPVVYCKIGENYLYKAWVTAQEGYSVDIWIDDMPILITPRSE